MRLSGVKGRAVGGDLALSGEVDFRGAGSRLRFDLAAAGMQLSGFPKSWGLPVGVDGRMAGRAKLDVAVNNGDVVPRGEGTAVLDDVSLAGYRLPGPVRLALRGADLDVRLDLPRIDLTELTRRAAGRAALSARLTVPVDRAHDRRAWRGTGRVESAAIGFAGQSLRDVAADWAVEGGRLRVVDARAEAAGGVVTASLDADLADLRGRGNLAARGLDLGPWLRVGSLTAVVSLDPEGVELKDVRASAHGGAVTGWGRLAFAEGAARLELLASRLDAGRLAKALSRGAGPVEGELSGQLSGVYRPVGGLALQFDAASPRLAVLGVPAKELRGRLDLAGGQATYQLTGETLAGRLSLEGRYPPPPGGPAGRLRLERLRLARLWEALGVAGRLGGLEGTAEVNLPYTHDGPGLAPVGQGRFDLRGLRWQGREFVDHLGGDVRVGPEGVSLRDAGALVAGGNLRVSGAWRFDDPSRGWFDARLAGAELSQLPLDRDVQDRLQGAFDVSLRGTLGPQWRGAGAVSLSRGRLLGVEVSDWRVPLEFSYSPSGGQAEVSVRESTAQLGSGRAQFRADLRYAGAWRAEGNLVLFDAGLRGLAGLLGDVASFARGRVSGRVDFSAPELRSLADLTANVQAKLNDAQALQLPVLRLLVPHMLPGQGALEFQAGELRGRLAGGVFRVSELTLDSSLLLLLLQGSVTLQGRLDLDVTAQTNSAGVDPLLLRSLLRRLPAVGPVPVGLLLRATEVLSDRVVHLRVSGTLRSPRVQVEPLRLLSDQAARYFLSRAVQASKP
ncbi:MAG: AsmA-like C-terminal region-containing protein [Gemmataceae bacterium]